LFIFASVAIEVLSEKAQRFEERAKELSRCLQTAAFWGLSQPKMS
jgi:hypothetical protein